MSNEDSKKEKYPKQLILERKGARLFRFTKSDGKPVKVFPGVNIYDDAQEIKQIMDHHAYSGLIESGAHKILNKTPGNKSVNTKVFSAMTVEQCKEIISKTYSIPACENLQAQEMNGKDRKQVISAIQDQIKILKNPSDKVLGK